MRLEENKYKEFELKISDYDALNVKFENHYTEQEIKIMLIEIRNAIKYVFGDYDSSYLAINIKVIDELKINGYIVNGNANYKTLDFIIATKNINNIFKLRNVICHELVHFKFVFDNLSNVLKTNRIIALYYVNEFWACKISREYSNDIKDANIFKNLDLDYELKAWDTSNIENKKMFATGVCSWLLENDGIDNISESNKKYLILKRKIEDIGFNTSESDLEMLEEELLKLNLM